METCKVCRSTLDRAVLPNIGGVEGNTAIAVSAIPYLTCPQGHEKRFVYPDFAGEMLEKIFASLPKVAERGMFAKSWFCCKCRRSLMEASFGNGRLTLQISLRDLESLRVEFAGLLLKCPFCGQSQVQKSRKLSSEVSKALARAFWSVGLKER